jgi:tetratricopeptide (TPR) repeat protein
MLAPDHHRRRTKGSQALRSRRQQLHVRIAAILEDRFPEIVAAQPTLLAHHCEEGGLTEKAVDYSLVAGRQAWGRSMLAEAIALFRRGVALVVTLPDADWRREREFDLQVALAQALIASQGFAAQETSGAYNRARRLAATLKRRRALLVALYGQWVYHVNRADLHRARQLVAEIRALGEDSDDVAARMLSHQASNFTFFALGEFTAAREDLQRGRVLFDPADRPFYTEVLAYDPLVVLLAASGHSLASLGYLDQALSGRNAALAEARRLSHPHTLALALALAWAWGTLSFIRSEPKLLCQGADELLAFSVEHGLGYYRSTALVKRGWCLAALGHADEGIPLLNSGLVGLHEGGFMVNKPGDLTLLADACRMAGQLQAALAHLAEAKRVAEETGGQRFQGETLRLTGDVRLAMGDAAAAECRYAEALALAQRQGAKLWELCAAMSLARLWRDQGKRAQARDLLAPVHGWFTEGFGTPVLQEAKILVEELAI